MYTCEKCKQVSYGNGGRPICRWCGKIAPLSPAPSTSDVIWEEHQQAFKRLQELGREIESGRASHETFRDHASAQAHYRETLRRYLGPADQRFQEQAAEAAILDDIERNG